MKKYGCLLLTAAEEFGIQKGERESQERWKSRIIYSILGRAAYASVFDRYESTEEDISDPDTVSIVHLKRKVQILFDSYMQLYPEISQSFSATGEELSGEIYDILSKTGQFYHTPYRLCAAVPCSACVEGVNFERGMPLNRHPYISGTGTYTNAKYTPAFEGALMPTVKEMFGLPTSTLFEQWNTMVSTANWTHMENKSEMEFLQENRTHWGAYWINQPIVQGDEVSLCRTRGKGSHILYIYRKQNNQLVASPVPDSFVHDPHFGFTTYRAANCVLAAHQRLPAILYQRDGNIVQIALQYLLPLPELSFLKLYSWPLEFWQSSRDFRRVLSTSIFHAVSSILESIGYSFTEAESNVI